MIFLTWGENIGGEILYHKSIYLVIRGPEETYQPYVWNTFTEAPKAPFTNIVVCTVHHLIIIIVQNYLKTLNL